MPLSRPSLFLEGCLMLVRMKKNHGYAKRGQIVKLEESIADFFVLRGIAEWTTQPVEFPAEEKPVEKPKRKRRRKKRAKA